jgi:hypothetical protein
MEVEKTWDISLKRDWKIYIFLNGGKSFAENLFRT